MKRKLLLVLLCLALTACCLALTACKCDHDWDYISCELPKTCSKCGATEGDPVGHVLAAGTYVMPDFCLFCLQPMGRSPIDGTWRAETDIGYLEYVIDTAKMECYMVQVDEKDPENPHVLGPYALFEYNDTTLAWNGLTDNPSQREAFSDYNHYWEILHDGRMKQTSMNEEPVYYTFYSAALTNAAIRWEEIENG